MAEHNYQREIERLVAAGILGNTPGETERVTLAHRTKRGRGDFDTSTLSEKIARAIGAQIITVEHDSGCRALRARGKLCNCAPDIIVNGRIVNRGLYEQIHKN